MKKQSRYLHKNRRLEIQTSKMKLKDIYQKAAGGRHSTNRMATQEAMWVVKEDATEHNLDSNQQSTKSLKPAEGNEIYN